MTILDRIEVVFGNVLTIDADLLYLKYAAGYHGADADVASSMGLDFNAPPPREVFLPGRGVAAKEVAFVRVGPLFQFRYAEIRSFAADMIRRISSERQDLGVVATTIHGPNYGLDEREAFVSMLQGYLDAADQEFPVRKLLIVERSDQRAKRLSDYLEMLRQSDEGFSDLLKKPFSLRGDEPGEPEPGSDGREELSEPSAPIESDEKPRLFVAMPFAEDHLDEYDIAFVESAHSHGFICERLDMESFVGDVTEEIAKRIRASRGIIALLNDNNPNVFFEVGYAMALEKPIIFVARKGQQIPFDVRNQRRVVYSRIAELRDTLRSLIGDLKNAGTLA